METLKRWRYFLGTPRGALYYFAVGYGIGTVLVLYWWYK